MVRAQPINREEVLTLKASGLTNREIAQHLGCSKAAVRYHSDPEYRAKRLKYMREYRRRRRMEQKKS